MQLEGPPDQPLRSEWDMLQEHLPLQGATVLELGCGAAAIAQRLANEAGVARVIACEVDSIQHAKNLNLDVSNLEFKDYGAEAIAESDASVDVVLMFKSLHHVPNDLLAAAMREIHRVLKPGGLAYVSEPVFAGAFNEVIRLFHDEQAVRQAAFNAMREAVDSELFTLEAERFYLNPVRMHSFTQFEQGILAATHTEHRVSATTLAQVRERFESNRQSTAEGDCYYFESPNRVDLLRKH